MTALLECVPNFSEGDRPEVAGAIIGAMERVRGVWVLDSSMDVRHGRAVVTLAGEASPLVLALLAGAGVARNLIDLSTHHGVHPRMGALDVCPFVPLGDSPMAAAVAAARRFATLLADRLDIPAFLYGEAAERPDRVHLADVRRGQFEGLRRRIGTDPAARPDRGPPRIHPTAGATAVGARFFLIAYNVNLETDDVTVARRIAAAVRERDGGLAGVRALGFPLAEGLAQVSMNLTDYRLTGIREAYDAVARHAAAAGVRVRESELVGLVPAAALDAETARHVGLGGFDPAVRHIEARLRVVSGREGPAPAPE